METNAQIPSKGPIPRPPMKNNKPKAQTEGNKKAFKKKPSPDERREQRESTIPTHTVHATGFASVHRGRDGNGFVLRGLYVPGTITKDDEHPHTRNRMIILGNSAPRWVYNLCEEIVKSGDGTMLRVNVTRFINENTCIAFPCAKSAAQARAEWKRHQSQLLEAPQSIEQCEDYYTAAKFVHEHAAKLNNLVIVRHDTQETQRPYGALAVNNTGAFFRIYGGDEVFNFSHGISKGMTTLAKEIQRVVKIERQYQL